ncbi:MAG: hypothetical protein IT201_01010 [Thermoleophilia bacterium]|nr:hypothetical protein [Thermoleophilia bacterium]
MSAEPTRRLDPADYQARLDRISELFSSMIEHASELSTRRCPYRDRLDRCTAAFGCRNQRFPEGRNGTKLCGGDDKLDYRSAWETS